MIPSFFYPSNCPVGTWYAGENLPTIHSWFKKHRLFFFANLMFELYSLIHFWKVTLRKGSMTSPQTEGKELKEYQCPHCGTGLGTEYFLDSCFDCGKKLGGLPQKKG